MEVLHRQDVHALQLAHVRMALESCRLMVAKGRCAWEHEQGFEFQTEVRMHAQLLVASLRSGTRMRAPVAAAYCDVCVQGE